MIDTSDWILDETDLWLTGTREKKWYIDSQNQRWMFKEPKIFGEIYAEVVASVIGKQLFQLSIPDMDFAIKDGIDGVAIKSFLEKNEEFMESVDFFGADFDEDDLIDYTVEKTLEIVKELNMLSEFFTMCIFDFLIANQDRHCQNWGVLKNISHSSYQFAPLYDHGSSLFNGLNDAKVKDLLLNTKQFEAFTNRSRAIFTLNGKKRPKYKAFLKYLIFYDRERFCECFTRFNTIQYDTIKACLHPIDGKYINFERKRLICRLIMYRLSIIQNLLTEEEERC